MKVEITVNGRAVAADVEDRMLLVYYLREVAGQRADRRAPGVTKGPPARTVPWGAF